MSRRCRHDKQNVFDGRVYTAAFCWYLQGMFTADAKYLLIKNHGKDKMEVEPDQNKCQW